MTVAELIEELQKFEPSMRVVTFCHYGYNDIDRELLLPEFKP